MEREKLFKCIATVAIHIFCRWNRIKIKVCGNPNEVNINSIQNDEKCNHKSGNVKKNSNF